MLLENVDYFYFKLSTVACIFVSSKTRVDAKLLRQEYIETKTY